MMVEFKKSVIKAPRISYSKVLTLLFVVWSLFLVYLFGALRGLEFLVNIGKEAADLMLVLVCILVLAFGAVAYICRRMERELAKLKGEK